MCRHARAIPARTTALGAALASLSFVLPAAATPPDVQVSPADFNGDGVVDWDDFDIQDANDGVTESDFRCAMSPYLGFPAHLGQTRGDANRDGVVDSADYNIWINALNDTDPAIPEINSAHISFSWDTYTGGGGAAGVKEMEVVDSPLVIPARTYTLLDGVGPSISSGHMWHDYTSSPATGLEPSITILDSGRTDGFDLQVVYDNSGGMTSATYGTILIGNLEFDGDIAYEREFAGHDGEIELGNTVDPDPRAGLKWFYPIGGKYSPTFTLRGLVESNESSGSKREYVMGVSVQYPLLEYQHGVTFWVKHSSAKYWLEMSFNDDFTSGTGLIDDHPGGDIPAGETRTYIVTVRFIPTDEAPTSQFDPTHPNDYLFMFQEYRRYFKRLYGNVRYTRDPRPVGAYNVGGGTGQVHGGFNPPYLDIDYTYAPACGSPPVTPCWEEDDLGWLGWIKRFQNGEDRGFERAMLWAPSGVAYNAGCSPGHAVGYPFQFTTQWDTVASSDPGHPILDTQDEMYDWATDDDREVGLWWGNSVRPASWGTCDDDSPSLIMDVCDTGDVSDAEDEMGEEGYGTGVYAIGTQAVGLDAFIYLRPGDAYAWLSKLVTDHPNIRFVTEPTSYDIIHTLAPSFQQAYYISNKCNVISTNAMADFLNKGHETWGQIFSIPTDLDACGDTPETNWGSWTDEHKTKELMKRLAARGFVPVNARGIGHEDASCAGCEDVDRFHYGWEAMDGPNLLDAYDTYNLSDFNAVATWTTTVPSDLQD